MNDTHKWQDKASVRQVSIVDKLRTLFKMKLSGIKYGTGTICKPDVEFRLTDNADISFGQHCVIQNFAFIQLTKPEPKLIVGDHVVTKDVPPYAIVGGIPAKIIKYRGE